jgi:hypothetical protein
MAELIGGSAAPSSPSAPRTAHPPGPRTWATVSSGSRNPRHRFRRVAAFRHRTDSCDGVVILLSCQHGGVQVVGIREQRGVEPQVRSARLSSAIHVVTEDVSRAAPRPVQMNGMGDGGRRTRRGRSTRRVRLLATTATQQQEQQQDGKNCEEVCGLPATRSTGLHAIPLRRRKMSPQPCAIEWQDSIRSHHLRAAPFAFCGCACLAERSGTAEFNLNTWVS